MKQRYPFIPLNESCEFRSLKIDTSSVIQRNLLFYAEPEVSIRNQMKWFTLSRYFSNLLMHTLMHNDKNSSCIDQKLFFIEHYNLIIIKKLS